MASEGPSGPGSAISEGSDTEWTNPSNAETDDANAATCALAASGLSDRLRALSFGFSVPAGATVDGILVEWKKGIGSTGFMDVVDGTCRVVESGSYAGDDKADSVTQWSAVAGYASYGGASDDWNVTWTTGVGGTINASGFGSALSAQENSGLDGETAEIYYCRITVYYTEAAGKADTQTRTVRARRSANLRM